MILSAALHARSWFLIYTEEIIPVSERLIVTLKWRKNKKANLKTNHASDMKKQLLFSCIIRIDMIFRFFKIHEESLGFFFLNRNLFLLLGNICILHHRSCFYMTQDKDSDTNSQKTGNTYPWKHAVLCHRVYKSGWMDHAFTHFTSITPKNNASSSKLYIPVERNYKTI